MVTYGVGEPMIWSQSARGWKKSASAVVGPTFSELFCCEPPTRVNG
jgi:hypothetical protein